MKNGFTLAEVLITLVIIGVIAALTVPALIQNTQKQEYVSALKKAYSTLSQVAQIIIAEEGTPKCNDGGWACSNEEVKDMFIKHLNSIKDCGLSTNGGCFYKGNYYNPLGDKGWGGIDGANYTAKFRLADGAGVGFDGVYKDCITPGNNLSNVGSNNVCAILRVDINGDKKPNLYARDYFMFVLKENGVFPAGCDLNNCPQQANNCACKVLTEGAMNY